MAKRISVTLSLGVAVWDGHSSLQELVEMADAAMYRAETAKAAIAPRWLKSSLDGRVFFWGNSIR